MPAPQEQLPEQLVGDDHQAVTIEDVRRALHSHARWKVAMAERAAVMLLAGHSHHEIRSRLGLSVDQYRNVRRWLREALHGRPYGT